MHEIEATLPPIELGQQMPEGQSVHPAEALQRQSFDELALHVPEINDKREHINEAAKDIKNQSKENFALFLTDLNRRLQGSDDTLVHDDTMKIGDKETIAPEDRYDLFTSIYEKVQGADQAVNPARVGDALALATVMLHPFKDGNGRTARTLGYLYRADFNDAGDVQEFGQVIEPRDEARKRGGYMINGYVPYMEEGSSQSDPAQVGAFIDRILQDDTSRLYTSPYGQAPIHAENSSTEVAG